MHSLELLTTITIGLVVAFFGGLVARQLRLPTIVGYLAAGMIIGPFTPGFVGDVEAISQLAEIGVILLMFGVGLHFSLKDLWSVRDIAIPGALAQMGITTGLGFILARYWAWSVPASLVFGLAIGIASTVVLLRGLIDAGLLNTLHGQVAVGWLVLEDLATVFILVLLPALFANDQGNPILTSGLALLKAGVFIGVMLFAGARLLPWLLTRIAFTRSRELFILAVVAVAMGTAFGSAELFGVSLALGAFLAGVVLGESPMSHQIGAEVLPLREIFTVLFFVSVGMLVNPSYLLENADQVIALTILVVIGKSIITILLGALFPYPARTAIVAGVGLSQIGEFSFILGQAGVHLNVLSQNQYSLILAGAFFSIIINPLMFHAIPYIERTLQRFPAFWRLLDRHGPTRQTVDATLSGHVVVVGYGRVGEHIVMILEQLGIPRLVVEIDARRVEEFEQRGVPTLFGDAANSEVLAHAGLDRAAALVVTLPDAAAVEVVVAEGRVLAPGLPIIARASTQAGVPRLISRGAQVVIHPELEGGLEIMRHTLLVLGYPPAQVQQYSDAVRRDQYNTVVNTAEEYHVLNQLRDATHGMAVSWRRLEDGSPLIGQTLAEADLRAHTGASVVAIIREQQVIANPKSRMALHAGDLFGLIGTSAQIEAAEQLLTAQPMLDLWLDKPQPLQN